MWGLKQKNMKVGLKPKKSKIWGLTLKSKQWGLKPNSKNNGKMYFIPAKNLRGGGAELQARSRMF